MWKKLLKGLLWLVVLVAAAGYLFVWQGLGVNPLEGDEEHLWDLVSNDVGFFARFPGADLLSEPVVEGLGEEEALSFILDAKEALGNLARDVARDVNPQIPLALFQVDLERDLAGKEMAIAGIINPNLSVPKLERFVALLRIPGYAKFVSALQRDFVRSKVPQGERIEVVRGLYFKVKDKGIAEALAGIRAGMARQEPDALWFARIRDVLLVTDEPMWIEDALRGGAGTLPADVDFKTEFIPLSRRGDIEIHMRPGLASGLFRTDRRGGPLDALSRLVPPEVLGNLIVQATPEGQGIGIRFVNHPERDRYARMTKAYAIKLYEREKADLRFDFTENGIARLLPRRGVVGAVVLHADADTFAALAMDSMSEADRSNLDSLAAKGIAGGRAYASYETLLAEIGKDLAETHMLVIHRPAIFDGVDLTGADQPMDDANPSPQPSFSFVSAIRDNVSPEKVVEKITQNLRFLGLKKPEDASQLLHPSGKYYVTDPLAPAGDFSLFHPAYAALTEGGRYFVFTSSPENMEAILAAAADPEARLLAEPGVAAAVGRLPAEGTLAMVARGASLRDYLTDRVRTAFWNEHSILSLQEDWRKAKRQQGIKDETPEEQAAMDQLIEAETDRFKREVYPEFRDDYRRRCAALSRLDTAVLGVALGVGPSRMVKGQGYLLIPAGGGSVE
jgi:hypothetical protein